MASSSGVPPGVIAAGEYKPTEYVHDDPVGPRRQFIYDENTRPKTDWSVLTLGIDANASAYEPEQVQVPLGLVLIGLRCNEETWVWPYYAGCRVSLTPTLLPFEMEQNLTVAAPMARGDSHVYRITVSDYDSLNLSLTRDVFNLTHSPARGLVGAAMLQRESWARPGTIDFPHNLSRAPHGTDLDVSPDETQAMLDYMYAQLRQDKGLLNLPGCASGDGGCRGQFFPPPGDGVIDEELYKQTQLREHLWARALPTGRSYAALHDGAHDTYVERVCVGAGAEGTYYLTVYADATLSGDGRLSASADGFLSVDDSLPPPQAVEGVEAFGWSLSTDKQGCFCCGDDAGLPSGTCGLCTGAVPECAGLTQPPASLRVVKGYILTVTHYAFAGDLTSGNSELMGCVSYGQWRQYEVQTSSAADSQLVVTLTTPSIERAGGVAAPASASGTGTGNGGGRRLQGTGVGGLYAAAGRPPTATDYDLYAAPPLLELTLTPCDVRSATRWYIAVMLGDEEEGTPETLFKMRLRTSSALATVGPQPYYGATCCGGTLNWMVADVPANEALSVNLTVLSGAVHAIFLQYDSCTQYVPGDRYQSCGGLCEAGWVTRWDTISGERHSEDQFRLTVPMGQTVDESDKRRAGAWYVGIKALAGESATFLMQLSLLKPPPVPPRPYCSSLDRFCASGTQRHATLPVTTAADTRVPGSNSLNSGARASQPSKALSLGLAVATAAIAVAMAAAHSN